MSASILVVGAYFTDQPSRVEHIVQELAASRDWKVVQAWAALGAAVHPALARQTAIVEPRRVPKFQLLNRLLAGHRLADYTHVLVVDDDITVPAGFVDGYLKIVQRRDFALSQPARHHASYTDHRFVNQLLGIESRETTFVEIGPLFVVAASAYGTLFPFEEESAMGWGYDYVWPVRLRASGLRLGIVDLFPVTHDLRKPVQNYCHAAVSEAKRNYLACREHLRPAEVYRIVASYPSGGPASWTCP